MPTTLTPIFTGHAKVIAPLHKYDATDSVEDVIVIIDNPYGTVHYVVVDSVYETVTIRDRFTNVDTIKKEIVQHFPDTTVDMLYMHNVFGLHNTTNADTYTTLFFEINHKIHDRRHLVQVDIVNNDITTSDITLIETHIGTSNVYMNTFVRDNVFVNDYKTVNATDVYIAYVNLEDTPTSDIANAGIQGLRVLVTQEEKDDFAANAGITLRDTVHPIVDIWSQDAYTFFNLTSDTTKVKFNFSTGLGFLQFKEDG